MADYNVPGSFWYLRDLKREPPNDIAGATGENSERVVLLFTDLDLAESFVNRSKRLAPVRLGSAKEIIAFMDEIEKIGYTHATVDPSRTQKRGLHSTIEFFRRSFGHDGDALTVSFR
jgi:hypothetical protein